MADIQHKGGCHCGKIRFEIEAPEKLKISKCNCSICNMRQFHHVIVPFDKFKLLQGEDNLTLYTFNTNVAKHFFCKSCGIESFYQPRSNPDGISVMYQCLDPGTVESFEMEDFDGKNWEESMKINAPQYT